MREIFILHMNWMAVQESDETISYYNIIYHTITLDIVKKFTWMGRGQNKMGGHNGQPIPKLVGHLLHLLGYISLSPDPLLSLVYAYTTGSTSANRLY